MNGTIYGKQRKRGGEVWTQKEDCRSRIYLALKKKKTEKQKNTEKESLQQFNDWKML